LLDWLVDRPFVRRYPTLSGILFAVGLTVVCLLALPPVFWVFDRFSQPVFGPLGRAIVWWWQRWN
jgi:hypothetical protein